MRVNGEGWHSEDLCHYHGSGLVAHSWQRLERFKVIRYVAIVFLHQDLRQLADRF